MFRHHNVKREAGNAVAEIEIYTSPWCGFCHRAKQVLAGKGVAFTEIDVTMTPGAREQMVERGGGRTVPQIFADGSYVGDCNGILALDAAGELDARLGLTGAAE